MSDPKQLELVFSYEAPTATGGKALLAVSRLPDGASLALGLDDGASAIAVRLDRVAACALGVELIAAAREVLAEHAGQMDPRLAQELAACLLAPTAAAELMRRATEGQKPS